MEGSHRRGNAPSVSLKVKMVLWVAALVAGCSTPGQHTKAHTAGIGSLPEIDTNACARAARYTPEAEQQRIEGVVMLRVALDEKGRVADVRVIRGIGHGLDEAAVHAISHDCTFTPARDSAGRAIPFAIPYEFQFRLR
jgi:TonB family protein